MAEALFVHHSPEPPKRNYNATITDAEYSGVPEEFGHFGFEAFNHEPQGLGATGVSALYDPPARKSQSFKKKPMQVPAASRLECVDVDLAASVRMAVSLSVAPARSLDLVAALVYLECRGTSAQQGELLRNTDNIFCVRFGSLEYCRSLSWKPEKAAFCLG